MTARYLLLSALAVVALPAVSGPARASVPREDLGEVAVTLTQVVVHYGGGDTVRVNGATVKRADLAGYISRLVKPVGGPAKVPVTLFIRIAEISPTEYISVVRPLKRMGFAKFYVKGDDK